jgi:transcription factor SPN1
MDEALRTNKPARRGRGGIDLEAAGDAELEQMRQRMADACQRDAAARAKQEVATHKLKLLPEVTELLNRNTLRGSIVDPDINILEAVRFFLEPADVDAALPNYQIQRELFAILGKLTMTKEALIASGIGKVILFYTKSTQPQLQIKRAAEKLTGDWMRVVLGKRKDMRAKVSTLVASTPTSTHCPLTRLFQVVPTATYDPLAASQRPAGSQIPDRSAQAAEKRRQKLALPVAGNRARVEGTLGSYSVMPANNLSNVVNMDSRRMGAAGDKVFKRMVAKGKGKK